MKGYMLIIRPHPSEELQHIEFHELSSDPTLKRLREIVGGDIEKVPVFDEIEYRDPKTNEVNWHRCVVYCNEHGKHERLDYNAVATVLWTDYQNKVNLPVQDVLVGSVVALWGDAPFMRAL